MPPHWSTWTPLQGSSHTLDIFRWPEWCFDGYGLQSVRIQSQATEAPTDRLFFLKVQPHDADHHQISDETLAARIRSTCLIRTVPHKMCAAARTNVPLFIESKSTRNPTTVVSDPSHNPHKHYSQIKMGNVKCRTLYIHLQLCYIYVLLQHCSWSWQNLR